MIVPNLKAWALQLLAAIALLVLGFGTGWHEKGVHVAASETRQAHDQVQQIDQAVQQQASALQQRLQREQDASAALLAQQQTTRAAGADIRLEISHADLSAPAAPGVAPSCPDPVGGDEFARLYQRAAGLDPAPAGAAGAR